MYNIIMHAYVVLRAFSMWVILGFIPMLLFFIPVIPVMLLAFPMIFLNDRHWTCKPYLWYFNTVWLKYVNYSIK